MKNDKNYHTAVRTAENYKSIRIKRKTAGYTLIERNKIIYENRSRAS